MTEQRVYIDIDLLQEAADVLVVSRVKGAVIRLLESVVVAARRRRHADRLEAMIGLDLDQPTDMSGAWR